MSDILHSFCYDSYKNLELKYKKSDDSQIEFNNQDWLNEARYEKRGDSFIYSRTHSSVDFRNVIKWTIEKFGESLDICPKLKNEVEQGENLQDQYESARENGIRVKSKPDHEVELPSTFLRKLLPYQNESVEHILALGNAANFSVPGGGKTTITYAAISRWSYPTDNVEITFRLSPDLLIMFSSIVSVNKQNIPSTPEPTKRSNIS